MGETRALKHRRRKYLGPDPEVGVGQKLGPLVLPVLCLQVAVQHAHGHAGQRHHEGQRLPHPGWAGGSGTAIRTITIFISITDLTAR